MRELGVEVNLFSTRKPPREQCSHDFAETARCETFYAFPPNFKASIRTLMNPTSNLGVVFYYIRSMIETPARQKIRMTALAFSAAALVQECRLRKIDHLHVHSFANSAHLAALCKLLGGPTYSITLHGDLPVYGTDHLLKIRKASFLSAVTIPLRKQIIESLKFPEDRVPVIPMGVDTDFFSPATKIVASSQDQAVKFVTVARLNATKGHKYVLEAVRRCRDAGLNLKYVIAGDGPNRQVIAALIDELQIADVVTLTGSIGEQQVRELLRSCHVFVLASEGLGEAAPVSVMEAMTCGLPVICSRIGGTADMITNEVDGLLVDQGDVSGLVVAMKRLSFEPDVRERLGVAARAKACEAFGFRENAKRLLDAIVEWRPAQV